MYVPDHVTQEDGSPSQWTNCWAAVGAWLADVASRGGARPTPSVFRRKARKPIGTPGGSADVERGLQRMGLWDECRMIYDVPKATLRERLLEPTGLFYGAESDFNVWPRESRCSETFGDEKDAYHYIGIIAGEGTDENAGKVRVNDPLCHSYRWVDVDGVVKAIVTYNNEHAGEVNGTADIIVARPPREDAAAEHDHREVIRLLRNAMALLKEAI
jgi:hypothetical protein